MLNRRGNLDEHLTHFHDVLIVGGLLAVINGRYRDTCLIDDLADLGNGFIGSPLFDDLLEGIRVLLAGLGIAVQGILSQFRHTHGSGKLFKVLIGAGGNNKIIILGLEGIIGAEVMYLLPVLTGLTPV